MPTNSNVILSRQQLGKARAEILRGTADIRARLGAFQSEIALLCDAVNEYLQSEIAVEAAEAAEPEDGGA